MSVSPVPGAGEAPAGPVGGVTTGGTVSEVAQRLLASFTSGRMPPGTRLPAERALAASLGVGRSTLREALAALDLLGVVSIRPGSGTYVRDGASELLPRTLSWGLMLAGPRTRDLVELRRGLEVQAAGLAAERAGEDDLAALEGSLERMRESTDALETFVEADQEFHRRLGVACGNEVLADLLVTVRTLVRVWAERALTDEQHARVTVEQHARVLAAVAAGDAAGAVAAMREHMDSAGDRVLRCLAEEGGDAGGPAA